MIRKDCTYDVYLDNKKVFTGTRLAIMLKFNLDKATFSRLIHGKQSRICVNTYNRKTVDVKIVVANDKPEYKGSKAFNSVKKHLDEYGNTILMKKHKYVLDELKDNKIKFNIREGVYSDTYWVIELVKD